MTTYLDMVKKRLDGVEASKSPTRLVVEHALCDLITLTRECQNLHDDGEAFDHLVKELDRIKARLKPD